MKNLQVDSSKSSEVLSGRDSTINKGLSELTAGELIGIIKENSRFYRKEIKEKSIHIRTMQKSLLQKNQVIMRQAQQIEIVQKQNEEARQTVKIKFERMFAEIDNIQKFIKSHDQKYDTNHSELLSKFQESEKN